MGQPRSFTSSGTVTRAPTPVKSVIPIAIKYPLRFGSTFGGPFQMLTSEKTDEIIISNFRTLMLTNHGEMLGYSQDFGSNLRSMLADRTAIEDFDEQAIELIKIATEKYAQNISLISFESDVLSSSENSISSVRVVVNFIIKGYQKNRRIEFILKCMG